jgi:hypothetical protein
LQVFRKVPVRFAYVSGTYSTPTPLLTTSCDGYAKYIVMFDHQAFFQPGPQAKAPLSYFFCYPPSLRAETNTGAYIYTIFSTEKGPSSKRSYYGAYTQPFIRFALDGLREFMKLPWGKVIELSKPGSAILT